MPNRKTLILGAGVTGLAAGIKTGFPILEANSYPGGICHSYQKSAYRFELGGGHWLFGQDHKTLAFLEKLTPLNHYTRNAAVYFADKKHFVPYPIQKNISLLSERISHNRHAEIFSASPPKEILKRVQDDKKRTGVTFSDQLLNDFGPELCHLFFFPFNKAYTAGLYTKIAPQDQFKNPSAGSIGYNATFAYPKNGLSDLIEKMAGKCRIKFNKKVMHIDIDSKKVFFSDKTASKYQRIISTLPLNQMVKMAGLKIDEPAPPFTSVLVLNIGAKKGKKCPPHHWLYIPDSQTGFYRVGFYSNVDTKFIIHNSKFIITDRVSLYVEMAFVGHNGISRFSGIPPDGGDFARIQDDLIKKTIRELQAWQFIDKVEVVDPTWIDVAYTWSWPGSTWREKALLALEKQDIRQIGRYGRWHFQGILESIKEGLFETG